MQKFFLFIIPVFLIVFQQTAYCKSPVVSKYKTTVSTETEIRENIVAFAMNYLGTPYKYASINPEKGFDCSGFVHFVFKNFDIDLPHSSKAFNTLGKKLKPDEFKVGDVLVFYGYRNSSQIGHVGIICEANGMNSKFIHSSSGKIKGVIISELNSAMYSKRFYKCIDVLEME
jgi:cell wall-associated NlpC family hydrolase